jgi:HD-GYP domain-containing protein (c-di-GMP phosphodiesterase class II)
VRQVPVDQLRAGMVVARTVFNARGDVLLRAGTALTESYVGMLRQRGYAAVLVADPDTDDVTFGDYLSERVRHAVTSEVCRLYNGIADPDDAAGLSDALGRLRESLVDMVDEVMGGPSLVALQAMRARDTYFIEHAVDGTVVALLIARRLGYDRPALQRLAAGCLTRDVGMAGIPPRVLDRPGPLSPEEWALVRQHAATGFMLLRRFRPSAVVANAVALQHHERQDGFGYPQGLRGTNRISLHESAGQGRMVLDAEIAAVADVHDALGADRPHRPALGSDRVVVELQRLAGGQLNRAIVGQLLAILPVFPVGSEVLVRTGSWAGHRGIVVAVDPEELARPVVRILLDRDGRRVQSPFELDLRKEKGVLAAVTLPDPATFYRATA